MCADKNMRVRGSNLLNILINVWNKTDKLRLHKAKRVDFPAF